MKIVVNALSARRGGGQTYLLNLLSHLPEDGEIQAYVLAPSSVRIPDNTHISRINIKWPTENPFLRTAWEKTMLPILLKKINADVLFCTGGLINTSPPQKCKAATTFHNIIPFDPAQRMRCHSGFERLRNFILERLLLKSMVNADLVIFLSEYARKIIVERSPRPLKNTVTISHGLSEQFKVQGNKKMTRPAWLPTGKYILYVSQLDFYKNQLEVVHGFKLLKQRRKTTEKLIFVGHSDSKYGRTVRNVIKSLNLEDDIVVGGQVPYDDMPSLYHHAKINIFASTCENCPNVLLEALGAGRPLLVSNSQPMIELGGNAVIYFDPYSPDDLANKLSTIIDDEAKLERLASLASLRSNQYNWRTTAHETWNAIRRLRSDQPKMEE